MSIITQVVLFLNCVKRIYGVVKCHRIFYFSNVIISNNHVYICLDEILVTICCSTALRYLGHVVKCPGHFYQGYNVFYRCFKYCI